MASINDVAKKAGVSKSTVSLVINNSGYVSQETRAKIEKVMKELNYVPNQLAKNLSNRKSNIIGIVMPDILHPFFSTFIKHAEHALYNRGYMTMICSTVGREIIEEKYLDMLERKAMDGIIMGSHSLNIERYKKTTQPIVSLDRFLDKHIPLITSNNKQGAQLTVDILEKNLCKSVIQIVGGSSPLNPTNDYPTLCKELASERGIEIKQVKLKPNSFSHLEYEETAMEIFQNHRDFDAIIGVDLSILACEKIALEKGISIPKDLKLISYDGTYVTKLGSENITSIAQPIEKLAEKSVEVLINLIENNYVDNLIEMLDIELQLGKTTY